MVVAGTLVAIPARLKGNIGEPTANITLVLPSSQEVSDSKGLVTISVLTDPLARDSVHGHALELENGHWLDICVLDMTPSNVES